VPVEFHQCHSICLFYHNIKDNERNLCQDLLTFENTDLKVHALHYANELLVRVRLFFQKLLQNRKIAQHTETIRKNVWEKGNDAYSLSVRVQNTINHFDFYVFMVFYDNINVKENVFFLSTSLKRHCATH